MGYHEDGIGIYRPDTNVKSTLASFHVTDTLFMAQFASTSLCETDEIE